MTLHSETLPSAEARARELHGEHAARNPVAADHVAYEMEDSADITLLRSPNAGYAFSLRVVALADVVPHEHYHGPRVEGLTERLLADGKLINPPVVARQGNKYVVLDGATRLTAFRQLGLPCLVVQVVELAQQSVQLTSWNHVVYGGSAASLLAALRGVEGLTLTPVGKGNGAGPPLPTNALGYLLTVENDAFVLETQTSSMGIDGPWLRVLNALVECYGQWGNVERTLNSDVDLLATQFAGLAALVAFPHFAPETVLKLAAEGRTVPAGITRFVIPGRILRLNMPLAKLAADEPLAAKQAWLDALIREKLQARQVRYYEEPVILLDE